MKFKILVALFAASVLVTGCDDKKESTSDTKSDKKDKKDKKDKGDKKDTKEAKDDGGEMPAACQEWKKCIDGMDDTIKKSQAPAFEAWEKSYKSATTEAKAAMETGCKTTVETLKKTNMCK